MRLTLLYIILSFFIIVGTVSAENNVKNIAYRIISHPDTTHQGDRATLLIKERIKPEEPSGYDWLWYMHEAHVLFSDGEISYMVFEVRKYQSTGNGPDSAIRVNYTIFDYNMDGVADKGFTDVRMLILEAPHEGSLISMKNCPDNVCKYEFKNKQEVYKDELSFWQNILQ